MKTEFNSRKKERRNINCFIEKDRRKLDRRGSAARDIKRKRKIEFKRHLNAQR